MCCCSFVSFIGFRGFGNVDGIMKFKEEIFGFKLYFIGCFYYYLIIKFNFWCGV